jgi:hypothetical protein
MQTFCNEKFLCSFTGIIPICLPVNDAMQQTISDKYTVAGFGFTERGQDSDILLKVVLPKVSKETCQSFHSSVIQLSEGHECYGGQGEKDSCKGKFLELTCFKSFSYQHFYKVALN